MTMHGKEHQNEERDHHNDDPRTMHEFCGDKNSQDNRGRDRSDQVDRQRPFPVFALRDLVANEPRNFTLFDSQMNVRDNVLGFDITLVNGVVMSVFATGLQPMLDHSRLR